MSRKPGSIRWYEKNPKLNQCVKLLEAFPMEIQTIISDGIVTLSVRECQADEVYAQLKSLGTEKVMALYKSHKKQRSYDKNPSMHKAMNYMYVLPEEHQTFLAEQTLDLVNNIYDYFKSCKAFDHEPTPDEIGRVAKTFIEGGSEEAKRLVDTLSDRFKNNMKFAPMMKGIEVQSKKEGMSLQDSKSMPTNVYKI
ncbi:MAG: hypothetical protein VKJ04_06885 [Vampirovibrionales bacterium]|nr:hypothetical protein [Vampirovibrionales bacterium]